MARAISRLSNETIAGFNELSKQQKKLLANCRLLLLKSIRCKIDILSTGLPGGPA